MTQCGICQRLLGTGDVLAADCGGDCYACILKCEHDLPWDIDDTELRTREPELAAVTEKRFADAIQDLEGCERWKMVNPHPPVG